MARYAISYKIELRLFLRAHVDPEKEGIRSQSYGVSVIKSLPSVSSKRDVQPGALHR